MSYLGQLYDVAMEENRKKIPEENNKYRPTLKRYKRKTRQTDNLRIARFQ